jgi:hypothetical protein
VPIRLPLLMRLLYGYASSPLLYIRVSLLMFLLAGVITSNSAVLLSISAVDNSTPSDTILTYSSAWFLLRLLLLLGSAALLTDSSPFFNSCLASDRFFSTSNNPFAISPSFG